MDVYVARQPIFDRKLNVFGYELLYRKSMNNFYEGTDDNQATAELINHAFFSFRFRELTDNTKAFINFSEELLLKEIPLLLPKDLLVVEILERVNNSEQILNTCRKLKEEGFLLALDDFVFHESYDALIQEVGIIKVEYPVIDKQEQKMLIRKYGKKVKFLAEKVETREDFQEALEMGYEYFQGYFFSKPVMMKERDIASINGNLIRIIHELQNEEPNYQKITEIIEIDVGLSYKLLRMANSIFFGSMNPIHSIKTALVRLGITEIRKWIYLMMLKDIQRIENKELIKLSLIRAKMLEIMAQRSGLKNQHLEYFMTGLFSSIDVLLGKPLMEILPDMALTEQITNALLHRENAMGKALNYILHFEQGDWAYLETYEKNISLAKESFMEIYVEALSWVVKLEVN
jgi:c-di-GMP-related signal transduction protein